MCAGETWNSWYLQSKNYTKIIIHFEDEVNIGESSPMSTLPSASNC